jgi:hypothetical protein
MLLELVIDRTLGLYQPYALRLSLWLHENISAHTHRVDPAWCHCLAQSAVSDLEIWDSCAWQRNRMQLWSAVRSVQVEKGEEKPLEIGRR